MTSVTIGIPHYDGVKALTAFSLCSAVSKLQAAGLKIHLRSRTGPYTHWNRDALVRDTLEDESDYLMMIDADLSFAPDGILRMLSRGKDVIGGFYLMKVLPPVNTLKLDDGNGGYASTKNWTPPSEPFPVLAVPTGFMLINAVVLMALPEPWFPCVAPVGEDVAFCRSALDAGFEVWCDPTFEIRHVGDYLY